MTKSIHLLFIIIIGALVAVGSLTLTAGQEFRAVRLGDNSAIYQIGKEATTNVVVGTDGLPSQGGALPAAMEREFGRKDFARSAQNWF